MLTVKPQEFPEVEAPLDSGDFSLMSRRVVDTLKTMPERRRFVRGMRSYVGFRQTGLGLTPLRLSSPRTSGRTNYEPAFVAEMQWKYPSRFPVNSMPRSSRRTIAP